MKYTKTIVSFVFFITITHATAMNEKLQQENKVLAKRVRFLEQQNLQLLETIELFKETFPDFSTLQTEGHGKDRIKFLRRRRKTNEEQPLLVMATKPKKNESALDQAPVNIFFDESKPATSEDL